MAPSSLLLTFGICFIVVFNGSLAQVPSEHQQFWQNIPKHQQPRLQAETLCGIENLAAQEPTIRFEFEAGVSEFWDQTSVPFSCAGVAALRNVIQPNGLLLPHYNDAPQLLYIVQGKGLEGTVIPGCEETFESLLQNQPGVERELQDRHQKIWRFRDGDILALPGGTTLWFYNTGKVPVVTVSVFYTENPANQLDQKFRIFFLAGNYPIIGKPEPKKEGGFGNIFTGLKKKGLANSFNIDTNLAGKLKGKNDHRGRIVRAERFEVDLTLAEEEADEVEHAEKEKWGQNALVQSACRIRLKMNLDLGDADECNPRSGLVITSVNAEKLPILDAIQLSAERGVLYKNATLGPYWNVNSHSIIYITRGSSKIQVVDYAGARVFDGEVSAGQLLVVPQYYVIMKEAGDKGCEWIAFKTNANAMISQLAGRHSVIRGLSVAVPDQLI